ncbi:GTPase-activating protein Gyp1p [Diutina catenulata]
MGKKQEMSQVYNGSNNEFIFGEHGGKGKNLSSFLKNLSLTGSSSRKSSATFKADEDSTNIYGNLGNSTGDLHASGPGSTSRPIGSAAVATPGAPYPARRVVSAPRVPTSSLHGTSHYHKRERDRYADLDDDWDAGLDEDITQMAPVSKQASASSGSMGTLKKSVSSGFGSKQVTYVDSFYPELGVMTAEAPVNDEGDANTVAEIAKLNQMQARYNKFRQVLTSEQNVNIGALRSLGWNGIPPEMRAIAWQILLGYLPTNKSRQASTLRRKRDEYIDGFSQVTVDFDETSSHPQGPQGPKNIATAKDKALDHQIKIDVKRTHPTIKFYSTPPIQKSLRKILYLWAVRHPASGYVQGINDLATPFLQIFVTNYLSQLQRRASGKPDELAIPGLHDADDEMEQALLTNPDLASFTLETLDPALLSPRVLTLIEADTYWCLAKLLENITDSYIHEQPGIHRQVSELRVLTSKIDVDLLNHFDREGIEFLQFSFRWMNCLLMREMSINLIIRMWDTYLSETPLGFNHFHVYVCAAFLIKFSPQLKQMDFQEIILFLQNPPTSAWTEKDVELMLSEAFIWQSLYKNAAAHLR